MGSNTQRYIIVAKSIQKAIEKGQYAIGSQLPTEAKLREQFSVSRCTIREALRLLRDQGYIVSQQGSGSRVVAATPARQYLQSVEHLYDVIKFNLKANSKIISQTFESLPKDIAKRTAIDRDKTWLKTVILRCLTECKTPIMLTTIYLADKYQEIKDKIIGQKTILELVCNEYHIEPDEIEQDIRAILLDETQYALLKQPNQHAALEAVRQYYDKSHQLFLVSCDVTPAYRYSYSMRMRIAQQNE